MSELSKIIEAMKGQRSTNGWDVVCCYSQEKINQIFKQRHQKGDIISNVKFSGEVDLPFVGKVAFESELKLRAPEITFSTEMGNKCKLTMDIEGGYVLLRNKENKEQRENIPADTIRVVCIAPIAAASGDWNEIHDGKTPIIFKSESESTHHIFLHFKNTELTTFTVEPIEGRESEASKLKICQPGLSDDFTKLLKAFFKSDVSDISYELAAIKGTKVYGIIPITPISFIFAQSTAIGNSPASLNLYIRTEESGNLPGDITPSFQPGGKVIAPVAEGYTASLIISGAFMEKMLLKGFKNYNPSVYSHDGNGLKLALHVDKIIDYPGYCRDVNHNFEGIKINMCNSLMYFSIKTRDTNTTCDLEFKSDRVNGYYYNWDQVRDMAVGGDGYIHVSFEIHQSKDLRFDEHKLISISAAVESNAVKVDADIELKHGGWKISQEPIVEGIKQKVLETASSIGFKMDSINTFVVSNFLFSDSSRFEFNAGDKYYMPFDFIAFGNIQSK
jgi:hypothetical protein